MGFEEIEQCKSYMHNILLSVGQCFSIIDLYSFLFVFIFNVKVSVILCLVFYIFKICIYFISV